jgi:hypothetical protein
LQLLNRDIVTVLPPGVEVIGYTNRCPVHGMYIPDKLITVQGHPEFKEQMMREVLILRNSNGVVDDATFSDAMSRAGNPAEGGYAAKAFLELLLANQLKSRAG